MAPTNPTKTPANRPSPGSSASKYRAQKTSTNAPTPPTSVTISQERAVTRSANSNPSPGTHGYVSTTAPPRRTCGAAATAHPTAAAGTSANGR